MNDDPNARRPGFARLVDDYYRAWFRYHPEEAVDAGVPGYADRLTPYTPDELGALVCLNDELMVALDEIDPVTLDDDQRIDRELLYNAARLENERLLDIEPQRPDPGRYLPVEAIYQLLIRPVEDFGASLTARLAAVPDHLRGARELLAAQPHAIPPLWLSTTVTAARAGADFLRGLKAEPRVAALARPEQVAAGLDAACAALLDYARFLEQDIGPAAQGEVACGRVYFDHLLARRHFLDIDAAGLRDFGAELFERTLAELKACARRLSGSDDVGALTRRIQADHPSPPELLPLYRRQMEAARDFVARHDLVTLPQDAELAVVETPGFLRHQIPFAAYSVPTPRDPRQPGLYYVTPPAAPEHLGEHNYVGVMHTCVHEAWPGHHLQFVTANRSPRGSSLPRFLNASATLYEGWALYCEQMMQEEGFLDRPEQRFLLLKDRLWRALRVLIDVDLHTAGESVEAAVDRMVRYLDFPRAMALADVTWYSRAPTVPMGYACGWALIDAARTRLRRDAGPFTLKSFHDRLLSQGSIALPLVLRREFGDGLWSQLRSEVFKVRGES